MVRKVCLRGHGCRARKRCRNNSIFGNFVLLNVGNVNLKSELGNFYDKMEKIKNIMLKSGIFKFRLQTQL